MNIILVAGTRPNFIKIAPIANALTKFAIPFSIVHTGQHYNELLNDVFFQELNIPSPSINLKAGSGSPSEQTGAIMTGFEKYLQTNKAQIIIVVGDVNSTMACSIVAKKMGRQLVHIEAGIRSFDLEMPEEINRLLTDAITDHFFTTSKIANQNLINAGVQEDKIHFVGNTMIDSLLQYKSKFKAPKLLKERSIPTKKYWLLTLHRPSNVDNKEILLQLLSEVNHQCHQLPVLFPVHPRVSKYLENEIDKFPNINFIDPLPYLEFLYLIENSIAVITDSGGIQEETTVLSIPCITLRKNTERPETITIGSNVLLKDIFDLGIYTRKIIDKDWKKSTIPELWDGKTSDRIVATIKKLYPQYVQ